MKYHASFVIFLKKQNLKLSSAANYRWHFMCKTVFFLTGYHCVSGQMCFQSDGKNLILNNLRVGVKSG